jgi:hypothetical protein
MSVSTTTLAAGRPVAASSTSVYATRAFWEWLWRTAGIQAVALFVVAYIVYGYQPLIATFIGGMAVLNLLWFAAALRTTLADAGQDGWGAAATASSSVLGGLLFLLITVGAALAIRSPAPENNTLTSAVNDFAWAGLVLTSFPRAMLIMAGSFGLWRAGLISNALFGAWVGAVVLVLLGGTTWMSDGFWAPDGAYSRFVSPIIGLVWVLVASRVLTQTPATRAGW